MIGGPIGYWVNDNQAKPVITAAVPRSRPGDEQIPVTVHVEDKSEISFLRAHYKPMPASYEWVAIDMQPRGDGNYTGTLPRTSEGILYYFEAADAAGNGANYPNFLEQTPYLSVNGWAPVR